MPRSGLANEFATHRHLHLLLALAVITPLSQVVAAYEQGETIWRLLVTLLGVSAIISVSAHRRHLVTAIVLAMPWLCDQWSLMAGLGDVIDNIVRYAAQLFFAYIVIRVYATVYKGTVFDRDRFYAALAGYIILVWVFSGLYALVMTHQPQAIGPGSAGDLTRLQVMARAAYFSVVTQTTLGYGDLSPAPGWPRALAMLQTLLGVLYLAVTIARLVGLSMTPGPPPR